MKRIGLLVEGGIDETLLPPLLQEALHSISPGRAEQFDTFQFPYPSGGFGEIPKNLRLLITLFEDEGERRKLGCDMFVIVHDSRHTEEIQKEIRNILKEAHSFPAVYGLAIQEIEAWVLADIEHLNREVFKLTPCPRLQRSPERDPDPKSTLTEKFIKPSKHIGFDRWNPECARMVAPLLRSSQVRSHCPKGFGRFWDSLRGNRILRARGSG